MNREAAEYLRLLTSELGELYRQAEDAVQDYARREERGAVTEHVFFENVELLRNEERCLRRFLAILSETDAGVYENAAALEEDIRARFRRHVEEGGCAPCTLVQAEAVMAKVAGLLRHEAASAL